MRTGRHSPHNADALIFTIHVLTNCASTRWCPPVTSWFIHPQKFHINRRCHRSPAYTPTQLSFGRSRASRNPCFLEQKRSRDLASAEAWNESSSHFARCQEVPFPAVSCYSCMRDINFNRWCRFWHHHRPGQLCWSSCFADLWRQKVTKKSALKVLGYWAVCYCNMTLPAKFSWFRIVLY